MSSSSSIPKRSDGHEDVIRSDRFVNYQELGRGSNGAVYAAFDVISGQHGAIKVFSPSEIAKKQRVHRNINETDVLIRESRFAPARNVLPSVPFKDLDGKPFIWMPQCHSTLRNWEEYWNHYLKGSKRTETILLGLEDIVHGVKELHTDFSRVHGDLNSDNIMSYDPAGSSRTRLVIADTGTATTVSPEDWSESPRDNIGHVAIRAPEVFADNSHPTTQSDVWSVGSLAVKLLSGKYPTEKRLENSKDPIESMRNIGLQEYKGMIEDSLSNIPKPLRPFLRKCLAYDPSDRYKDGESLEEEFSKAMKRYESSKPRARAKRWFLINGALTAVALGFAAIRNEVTSLNQEKDSLAQKVDSNKKDLSYERKEKIIRVALQGKKVLDAEALNLGAGEITEAYDFRAWVEKLGDEKTAIAAYLNPDVTYEAVVRAGGRTDYESVKTKLLEMSAEGKDPDDIESKVLQITYNYVDNWMRPQFHTSGDRVHDRWELAKNLYDAKQSLDKEQGEGTADRVIKERREKD
ncbi:MAG: serine/threonine-protein kinase [Nanoarchaeota archaeon]